MSRLKDTIGLVSATQNVATLVTTLEEVSVMRMQRVRDSVLKTRGYLDGLLDVFVSVRQAHQHEIDALYGKRHWWQKKESQLKTKNGKTIFVLISPTQRLGGEVAHHVFDEFNKSVKNANKNIDIAVVGKVGKDLFVSEFGERRPFTYFDWKENNADQPDLPSFLSFLQKYERVMVFTAQFQSLVKQEPIFRTLTGNEQLTQDIKGKPKGESYLCEPSITQLVDFFENQVMSSLFKQSLEEAHLAHLGSRVTALEQATQNINSEQRKLNKLLRTQQQQVQQQKQRQRLAGASLWQV